MGLFLKGSAETKGWDGLSFVSANLEVARWQASSRDLFRGSAVNGLDKNHPTAVRNVLSV